MNTISNPHASHRSDSVYLSPEGGIEMGFGIHENADMDPPCVAHHQRESGNLSAQEKEDLNKSRFCFNVTVPKRLHTSASSRSTGMDGMFDAKMVDSDEELVEK